MRILVFAPFFPPDPTGSSVFAGQQVRELLRQGHEVLVVSNRVDNNAPRVDETDDLDARFGSHGVRRVRSFRINLGKITWNYAIPVSFVGFFSVELRARLREFDPDAVIVHSTLFDLSLLGLLWSARFNKTVVVVSHTALWHDNRVVNSLMRLYGRHLLRRCVKRAQAKVVCVDKWTFDNAKGLFDGDQGMITIPVSVELGVMNHGDADKIRERHGLGNGPVILSLGHVVPLRDRINLTRALPLLLEKHPTARVVVVGMVKDETFLSIAEDLGVRDAFILTGPVPHDEIRNYLAAADVEIHDLDGRGLGITSVEAMDAGVPIVAWAVDDNYPQFSLRGYGPSGFIDDGKPETIASMIDQLLSDRSFRDIVITSQRKLVDDIYSVESVTSQYLSLVDGRSRH